MLALVLSNQKAFVGFLLVLLPNFNGWVLVPPAKFLPIAQEMVISWNFSVSFNEIAQFKYELKCEISI